jgi:acetyl-CoA acyltransferase
LAQAFICDGTRTPIGRYGGALAAVRADDLAAHPIRALIERNPGLDPAAIDDVILGCANQAGEDNRNVARMAALLAGLPVAVPGTTLNRLCASGHGRGGDGGAGDPRGRLYMIVAGGVESMSRAPFVMPKATAAFSRANAVYDTTIGWRFVNPPCRRPTAPIPCPRRRTMWRPNTRSPAPIRMPSPRAARRAGPRQRRPVLSPRDRAR